jgi:PST family polysaccharide transporter
MTSIVILKPDDEFTRTIVIIISISLVFKATDAIKYWYEARVQFRHVVWVENAVFVFMAMVRVALILSEASLMAFVWLTLIETLLISLGLILIYAASGTFASLFQWSPNRAKTLLKDSWPLLLSAIAVTLYMRMDLIMLEKMSSSTEVGVYAAAIRISEIWYFIPIAIVSSISPALIEIFTKDKMLFLSRLRRLYFVMFWLSISGAMFLFIFSEFIALTLYGADYSGVGSVLAIHAWCSIAVFLGVASSQYLLIEGIQRYSLYRTLVGLLANLILNILFIPRMGAAGAAIATLISYFISVFSLVIFSRTRGHSLYLMLSPFKYN